MTDKTEDIIDLSPVQIDEISKQASYISVIMRRQPCYSQMTELGKPPEYECEMRIYGGNIQLLDTDLPFETDDWDVQYKAGLNACFLPFSFDAMGDVKLTFRDDQKNQNTIIITGERLELKILKKASPPAPPNDQTLIAQELFEYISELSEQAICAGWMENVEFALWERVLNGAGDYYALDVTEEIVNKLRDYADQAGGWWYWKDRKPQFLSVKEWQKIYDQ